MRRYLILLSAGLCCVNVGFAQIQKHFSLSRDRSFDKVSLDFTLPRGTCYITPKSDSDLVSISSNQNIEDYVHSFEKKVRDNTCYVNINLEGKSDEGYGESISYRIFRQRGDEQSQVWKIYLADDMPYDLNLNYGIGDAFVDLSGLSVNDLRIKTASANVNVGFLSDIPNKVEMESFNVKVDLGSVSFRKMYLSRARNVYADVGFGNLYLDYSTPPKMSSEIKASVGAGDLIVAIPSENTPIIVKVKSSMLCRMKLDKSFKEIDDDVFVNEAYHPGAPDLLTFKVDVSMGNIIFKTK